MKPVSKECKDLIFRMLQPEDKRITLEQIYQHPWIKAEIPSTPLKLNFKRLKDFVKYNKVQICLIPASKDCCKLCGFQILWERTIRTLRNLQTNRCKPRRCHLIRRTESLPRKTEASEIIPRTSWDYGCYWHWQKRSNKLHGIHRQLHRREITFQKRQYSQLVPTNWQRWKRNSWQKRTERNASKYFPFSMHRE